MLETLAPPPPYITYFLGPSIATMYITNTQQNCVCMCGTLVGCITDTVVDLPEINPGWKTSQQLSIWWEERDGARDLIKRRNKERKSKQFSSNF